MPVGRHSLVNNTNDGKEAASPRQQGHTSYYLSPEELAEVRAKYPAVKDHVVPARIFKKW